ncbi:hypothetical protein BDV59DRAFT_178028 [Aspergillus ambiguus]|uniref:uncharacterized protein n=1 Tax=Aspergillus ambiguus TaxID=176160 RepID=UPI003CCCA6E0
MHPEKFRKDRAVGSSTGGVNEQGRGEAMEVVSGGEFSWRLTGGESGPLACVKRILSEWEGRDNTEANTMQTVIADQKRYSNVPECAAPHITYGSCSQRFVPTPQAPRSTSSRSTVGLEVARWNWMGDWEGSSSSFLWFEIRRLHERCWGDGRRYAGETEVSTALSKRERMKRRNAGKEREKKSDGGDRNSERGGRSPKRWNRQRVERMIARTVLKALGLEDGIP